MPLKRQVFDVDDRSLKWNPLAQIFPKPELAWKIWLVDSGSLTKRLVKKSGAIIRQPPTNFSWGVREMNIEDLDGHRFRTGTGTTEPSDGIALNEAK